MAEDLKTETRTWPGECALSHALLEEGQRCSNNWELRCPVCGFWPGHMREVEKIDGKDSWQAGWSGRGDLVVIRIDGECGHSWELCLGEHKGAIQIFARIDDRGCASGGRLRVFGPIESGILTSKEAVNQNHDTVDPLVLKWRYSAGRRNENKACREPITDKQKQYIEGLAATRERQEMFAELDDLINGYWGFTGVDDWTKADGMFVIGCLLGTFTPTEVQEPETT